MFILFPFLGISKVGHENQLTKRRKTCGIWRHKLVRAATAPSNQKSKKKIAV
jgi:hypothetical protein